MEPESQSPAGPQLLVLQHIACEPPGAYEDELRSRGGGLVRVEVDEGAPLPDWEDFDGIVVMGGPMGAYEDERLPWLVGEKRLIGSAARAGVPVWGVCLGAQLLAASLGAAVGPGPEPEVGVLPVLCAPAAAEDPVFSMAPDEFPALQWHTDTFALPEQGRHLARSSAYEGQAFAVNRAYGLQFHIEIGTDLATRWGEVPEYARSLEAIWGPGAIDRLLTAISDGEAEMRSLARRLFGAWLDQVVAPYDRLAGAGLSGLKPPR